MVVVLLLRLLLLLLLLSPVLGRAPAAAGATHWLCTAADQLISSTVTLDVRRRGISTCRRACHAHGGCVRDRLDSACVHMGRRKPAYMFYV